MSGIYIHIPFCKKICYYCDFHFSLNLSHKESFIVALLKEIVLQKDYLSNKTIETIYFGGGTPSILSSTDINQIFSQLERHFDLSTVGEITLEANPDDLSLDYLQALKQTRINRLSIGIQSFFDEDLVLMNRRHTASDAYTCVENAIKMGFNNITIDLMYGLPNFSLERWKKNIAMALSLQINHISAYHLTIEKQTAFNKFQKDGKIILPTEELSELQYHTLVDILKEQGFVHYEISNFARSGFYAAHNSNYWKQKSYLGLGPSAHSFNGNSRQWNISNNLKYISALETGNILFEIEKLSEKERFNEYILTSLRTIWGVNIAYIKNNFPQEYCSIFIAKMEDYVQQGHALCNDTTISLTNKGMFISDTIISDVFVTD
jgi:oxygen-independent coproporphyrinogen-3 oxidase